MRRTVVRAFVGCLMFVLIPLLSAVPFGREARAAVVVNCNKPGHTITHALTHATGAPITIEVSGTCHENVIIGVSEVTLVTTDGATVNGPDATKPTILVLAGNVVIDGFTIIGGSSGVAGVAAHLLTLENCNVNNAGSIGIAFLESSGSTIDKCTVQNNPIFGITVQESSGVTITNSTISNNGQAGIHVFNGGSARIGIANTGQLAGNHITGNQASGIAVTIGGSAFIGGNTITGNGKGNGATFAQAGIFVFDSTADVAGGNTISGNAAFGIILHGSRLLVGDPATSFTSANSITGNGTSAAIPLINRGGINAFLGSTIDLRDANVGNNAGVGLQVVLRSTARSFNTTIDGNSSDGVELIQGSAMRFDNPQVTILGNGGVGLNCFDAESSFAGNTSGITGNSGGNISPSCTGF
jgi:parallel beta-helix repeat protein